jgi:hypothetical protein
VAGENDASIASVEPDLALLLIQVRRPAVSVQMIKMNDNQEFDDFSMKR